MAKQTVTRRQKDVSRMIRDHKGLRKDRIEKKDVLTHAKGMTMGRKRPEEGDLSLIHI